MQVMLPSDGSALEAGDNSNTDYESRTGDYTTKRLLAGEKITYLYRSMFHGWGVARRKF